MKIKKDNLDFRFFTFDIYTPYVFNLILKLEYLFLFAFSTLASQDWSEQIRPE